MRVPVSWLRDYVTFDMPLRELGERMSMTGTKLEALHHRGVPAHVELYRVGRVLTRAQHPNADRLSLCTVDVGDGEPRQIVCGASNFEAGATVAVALPGAVLPDGTELRVAKLRGVESHGMMLSERELELGQDHAGIMLLPDDWPVGDALIEHLAIADDVLEFEITSNRPDCQNVYGIAREVSAVLDTDLAPWPGTEPEATGQGTVSDHVRARIDAPEMCPRWAARVFTDVRVGPSPPWLKARIAAAGMRPISNVVDITNYVMLAVGEPTHAFDLDRVAGREIIVRRATAGEAVTTLDGQQRVLDTETLVIADAERPSAIAGLMGSEWSEVTDETTTVLMECANFDGPSTQRASVKLGLRTEGRAGGRRASIRTSRRSRCGWPRSSWSSWPVPGWCRARSTCTATCPSRRWCPCASAGSRRRSGSPTPTPRSTGRSPGSGMSPPTRAGACRRGAPLTRPARST